MKRVTRDKNLQRGSIDGPNISVRIRRDEHDFLQDQAERNERSVGAEIRRLVRQAMEAESGRKAA